MRLIPFSTMQCDKSPNNSANLLFFFDIHAVNSVKLSTFHKISTRTDGAIGQDSWSGKALLMFIYAKNNHLHAKK
jgi:hypothetical protein